MGGSAPKPIRKITKAVTKPIKKAVSFVDKKVVEPLENPIKKKILKPIDKTIVEPLERPVKKVVKGVKNIGDEIFEEVVEKPFKKVTEEVVDTVFGLDKEDRRGPNERPTQPKTPEPSKVTAKTTAQKVAQGGLSTAEQRRLMQKNRAFRQTKI